MWALVAVLTVAGAGGSALGWYVRQRAGAGFPPRPRSTVETLDPADVDDVAARLEALAPDELRRRDEVLATRLRPLVDKRVPVRVVEPVPGLRVVRVRFADGTAVVGHGNSPGDAGVLAAVVRRHPVWISSCSTDERGMQLRFVRAGAARSRIGFVVTGLDQPD